MLAQPPYAIALDNNLSVGRKIARHLQGSRPDLPVQVATTWAEVEQSLETKGSPKVLVARVGLAESSSAALTAWRSKGRLVPWLATSDDNDPHRMEQAQIAGAQGFIHEQAPRESFARAFDAMLAGRKWFDRWTVAHPHSDGQPALLPSDLGLTPRQGEVLAHVLQGLSNKRIALILELSESTVKEHVSAILQKLGATSRVHAIIILAGRRFSLDSGQRAVAPPPVLA